MISPELLRRYPFFAPYSDAQLREIAMLSDEITAEAGTTLFEECQAADWFYLLIDGGIDLYYKSEEQYHPKTKKEFSVGEINPGEVVAISAMIDPYVLNATARVSKDSRLIKTDAKAFRALFKKDPQLGYITMHQIAKSTMERLAFTRVQLAAAWA